LKPVAESVGSEYQGRVRLVPVDAAVDPEGARALGAFVVPLLVALRDGREHGRRLGAATVADVRAVFEAALENAPVAALGLSRSDRALRILAGLGLAAIGLASGPRWGFVALGGVLLAFAFRDRLSGR
jgi:hypothetical protein